MRRYALVFALLLGLASFAPADEKAMPRFAPLPDAKAWSRLPRKNPPLPVWARVLSRSMPKTTVAMLKLDAAHRAGSSLNPVFRAKLRWTVARANGCEYSTKYAEWDMLQGGGDPVRFEGFTANPKSLPEKERLALEFARKLSVESHKVTDEEVAALLKHYGPKTLTAMVHTIAYGNFQDRILLSLGVEVEKGGPLPPLDIEIDEARLKKVKSPKRPPWKLIEGNEDLSIRARPEWVERSVTELQNALAGQKERPSRIPLPPMPPRPQPKKDEPKKDEPKKDEPPEKEKPAPKKRPSIVWSTVSMGYAPKLTRAWFDCMSAFNSEGSIDPVFSNSLFWVVTQSNQCFY